jgi:hypothetical protein
MSETIVFTTRPPIRSDGVLYTELDFEVSDTFDGPYTNIHSEAIDSYDPGFQPEMNFYLDATDLPAWYRQVWTDTNGDTITYPPVWYESVNNLKPTTREVANFIKNRTVDQYNNYLGDFHDATIVTRTEVTEIIDQVEEWVLRRLHIPLNPTVEGILIPVVDPLADSTKAAIRSMIALGSAAMVELTKFSEQIARGVSPYPYLKEWFDSQMDILYEDVTGKKPSTDSGGIGLWDLVAQGSGNSFFSFPDDPMVNWTTAF